jgi:hypothetical protein
MCCDDRPMVLPAAVETMLARYRDRLAERPTDWGAEWDLNPWDAAFALPGWLPVPLTRWLMFRPEMAAVVAGEMSVADAIRRCVGETDVPGLPIVRVSPDGVHGPPLTSVPWLQAGRRARLDLLVLSAVQDGIRVALPGREETVAPAGSRLLSLTVEPAAPGSVEISVDGTDVAIARVAEKATLRLESTRSRRWSVVDSAEGAWFPPALPTKWDSYGRPFFHGQTCEVEVPAGRLEISATNGIGTRPTRRQVEIDAGATIDVVLEPERRFDPRDDGWYGADLHAHANISGDLVVSPGEARCMQAGEDLDLLHLVAGNLSTELVYDRETFEATVGEDLPGSDSARVTRQGVEYRNDLLGHVHALGLETPPARYQTGHVPGAGQEDWPPNAVAIGDLRDRGALVGYCHPVWSTLDDEDPVEPFTGLPRSVEARELVADAALGLVDSIELISNANPEGTITLYHRLLDCGIRLAAVAGTDVFLSMSHGPNSDPPGWARVYAQLGDKPLSVATFSDAIRRGATMATNGPWLRLDVDGQGPGNVIQTSSGATLRAQALAVGPGVKAVQLVGPGGVLASSREASGPDDEVSVELALDVSQPSWLAARVLGERHPEVLQHAATAHTTPVYLDLDDERVASAGSARWCRRWLDHLERLAREHGRFAEDSHLDDLVAVIDEARGFYGDVEQRALRRDAGQA